MLSSKKIFEPANITVIITFKEITHISESGWRITLRIFDLVFDIFLAYYDFCYRNR